MISHASPQGFYLRNAPALTPRTLSAILDAACGYRPTVVLVSACYSGVFVGNAMLKPNRINRTAAREYRTSFGCSAENEYTYWDGCLIEVPSEFKRGQYALTNLLWYPEENVMLGGEFQWGRRANFSDGFRVNDYKVQFSFKFSYDAKIAR